MKLISLVLGWVIIVTSENVSRQLKRTAIAAVAPKPVDGVIPCMLKMVTEIDTCATKVAGMVECHDGGPDFAPAVCFREMITCFSDGMQNFAQCLETGWVLILTRRNVKWLPEIDSDNLIVSH